MEIAWKTLLPIIPLALLASTPIAQGEDKFSGEHAAYIDWSAKNCGVKSTSKAHGLVDEANAKDRDGFMRQYIGRNGSKELSDALTTPARQEEMCSKIKDWYGPSGSRIRDLLAWQRPTSPPADGPSAQGKGMPKGQKGMKEGRPGKGEPDGNASRP